MLLKAIDFEYISSTINSIIEKNHQENMQEIEKQTKQPKMQQPLYVRLGARLPNFILNKLHLYYQNSQTQPTYDMVDFQYNKMVCLNFLRYCLENKVASNLSWTSLKRKRINKKFWSTFGTTYTLPYPTTTRH